MSKSEHTMSFRFESDVHQRFISATTKLGMNASQILRDALTEKVEELEELATIAERLKKNCTRKPINELWNDLGLDNNVR